MKRLRKIYKWHYKPIKKSLTEKKRVWTRIYKWFYIRVQWMSENERIFNLTSNPGTSESLTHLQLKPGRPANNAHLLEQLEFLYPTGKHTGWYHFHRSDGHTSGEGHRKVPMFSRDPHSFYFLTLTFLYNVVLLKTGPSDKVFVNWPPKWQYIPLKPGWKNLCLHLAGVHS